VGRHPLSTVPDQREWTEDDEPQRARVADDTMNATPPTAWLGARAPLLAYLLDAGEADS
jgi:hypothetical protein